MDIRFLAWAGYDLSGKQQDYLIAWPGIDSDEIGKHKIVAKEIVSNINKSEELIPTIKHVKIDLRPTIKGGSELKPFPQPNED